MQFVILVLANRVLTQGHWIKHTCCYDKCEEQRNCVFDAAHERG